MVDFKRITLKDVKSKKLRVKVEVDLNNSTLTDQEACERIEYLINSTNSHDVSNFIVFLLRETRSSTWENVSVSIDKVE